jgi:hypothetical protein
MDLMRLTVSERLLLLSILPGQGDLLTVRIVRQLRDALSFSEKEHKELQFKRSGEPLADGATVPDGQLAWTTEADHPREVQIGDAAAGLIVDALKKLEAAELLTEALLPLWERFVEGKEAQKP